MLKLGKHNVEFYDSIDTLPFCRFNAFNKYVMLDAELGGDVMAFDSKISKIFQFLGKKMVDEALGEMYNLRNTYHNIMTNNNVTGLAFACLIKSIDGQIIKDFSQSNLEDKLKTLSGWGLTIGEVRTTSDEVKKNSKPN